MAERRMFAKTIIDSDSFLDMPVTARLLYYDLAMRADDDGFINSPKKIMRVVGASQDDLGILIMRKFIIPFDNGVVVIKHWRIHNYIRKDTYTETTYKEQKSLLDFDENKAYRVRHVDGQLTQDSIGKVSIGNNIYISSNLESQNCSKNDSESTPNCSNSTPKNSKSEWFEAFWKLYPRKEGKGKCSTKFAKICTTEEKFEEIMAALKEQVDIVFSHREKQYIPMPETWLNQKRWLDEVKPDNSKTLSSEDEELLKSIRDF